MFAYGGDEFTALLREFKVHIAEYLGTLSHTRMRTLADLIDVALASSIPPEGAIARPYVEAAAPRARKEFPIRRPFVGSRPSSRTML